jgi:DNA-binding response OmpR family regulator
LDFQKETFRLVSSEKRNIAWGPASTGTDDTEVLVSKAEELDREFKILVVDAHRDSRSELRRELQASHYAVITAENPSEAVRLALTVKPDLILINTAGPLEAPLDLSEQLKNNLATSIIPLVLLARREHRPDIDRAVELGIVDCVNVPYGTRELLARIRRALIGRYGRKRMYDRFRQFQIQIQDLVASQIRKRITVISGLAELIRKQANSPEEPDQLARIQGILQSADDLADLMDDIELMFKSDDHYEEIDLVGLIQSEIIQVRDSVEARSQKLSLDFPGTGEIRIVGNRPFLSMAVRQLILNVHRLTAEGGFQRIRVVRDSEYARIGMEYGETPDALERDHPVRTRLDWKSADLAGYGGTPIGLLIAGSIVEQHDGSILMGKPSASDGALWVHLPLSNPSGGNGKAGNQRSGDQIEILHGRT